MRLHFLFSRQPFQLEISRFRMQLIRPEALQARPKLRGRPFIDATVKSLRINNLNDNAIIVFLRSPQSTHLFNRGRPK